MAVQTETFDIDNLDFDPDALRRRYDHERDRRLQPRGEDQYLETKGDYAEYFDADPYSGESPSRDPLTLTPDVIVIGGGFAGMFAAYRLLEAGFDNLHIVESGADFGGTWYWNRFPGSQCDIESYCYMPLLEETNYMPTQKYANAPEIFEHCQRIARMFGLYEKALFQTRVEAVEWDDGTNRWTVRTNRGDDIAARFVISATGPACIPRLPDIPGIRDFKGHSFHTSRWDYEYTGGDSSGNLDRLHDKRVAVIGTGATAVQCVPHLGRSAKELYVFQRTPSSIDIRGNGPTDPEWAENLPAGWQKERQENLNDVLTGQPFEVDLVNDQWTVLFRSMKNVFFGGEDNAVEGAAREELERLNEIADFDNMNRIRARVNELVQDPAIAETLKPWYRQFCKRPCFHDDYLPTFNLPNVTLVDVSDSYGVKRITEDAVVANGKAYPVDCIIYATGFEISTSYRKRFRYDVNGVNGQSLYDHWKDGRRTLHGHSSHGFPNWFLIGATQVGVSANYSSMVDEQAMQIVYILKELRERGADSVQPTPEAEDAWVQVIRQCAQDTSDFFDACTPGYYNNEGKHRESKAAFIDAYAPGVNAFNRLLKEWRSKGDYEGLAFR